MGGAESVGGLRLEIPQRNFLPGQYVNGTIHFLLTSAIQADFLTLQFRGKEYIEWKEVRNHGKTTSVETFRGRHEVCVRRFPVFVFENGKVEPGSYSFPFSMQLPGHIPGSFYKKGRMMLATITYWIKAFVDKQKGVKADKVEIGLIQPFVDSIVPMDDEVRASIKSCCCVSKGEVSMKTFLNKSAYSPKETAEVSVQVDNSRSSANVKKITAELHRTLRLRNDSGGFHVANSTMSTVEAAVTIPAGTAGEVVRLLLPIDGNDGELERAATVKGTCLECIHSIKVSAVMSGWFKCCGQKPRVERLVTIYSSQLPPLELVEAPAVWNPVVMHLATFADNQQLDAEKVKQAEEAPKQIEESKET